MKNGWYKIEYKDDGWVDTLNCDEVVYVEDNVIVEARDEFGRHPHKAKCAITKEIEKRMAIMEFEGVGCA